MADLKTEIRYDRNPALVEMKYKWARVLLPSCGRDGVYKKIRELTQKLHSQKETSPGVVHRKPTLQEFCQFFNLPVDECSFLLNNRYKERIQIMSGPHCNQEN